MEAPWEEIEAVFAEALSRDAAERSAWLRTACAGRPAVLCEVEAMLRAHQQPLGIEPRLLAGDEPAASSPLVGARIGPYILLELLGHGGMGSVWLAAHADGVLDRRVAVKLVRVPHTVGEARALQQRFESERRILARLEHPGIVRLLEAGTASPVEGAGGGYPYFAMDYVAGLPITAYAAAHTLPLRARLRLFVEVCEAVHHAHQRLVIHRDLKPSNILVAEDDAGAAHVKLLDFGVARLLDDDAASLRTETGLRPMTRAYAAPEQIRGEGVTTAADVYALGVVLYELLTAQRPFDAPTAAALEHAILTVSPERPSAVLARAAAPVPGLDPHGLRGDLDAIVLTALRKEPEARYASAEAFAADIHRHLGGHPVRARAPSAAYRFGTFARRHRAGVAAAALAVVLLVGFSVVLSVQQRATVRERDTAQATARVLEELFGAADPFAEERLDTLRISDLLARGVERAQEDLADAPRVRARLLYVIGRSYVRLAAQAEAAGPLTEAAALARAEDDAATLAGSLTELAGVRQVQWHLGEAEALVREALALPATHRDPPLTARAEHVLALTLLNAGRSDEAEAVLQSSLARQRAQPNGDRTAILMAEQTLARALIDQQRHSEAERLLLDLRTRYARRFGPDDARLVGILNPLTFLYLAQGRMAEAEAVGAEAVALMRDAQPGSSALSQTLATYASVLHRQKRLDESEALLVEAIGLPSARPGSHAIPLGTLASIRAERGDPAGAIDAQQQALRLLQADTTFAASAATIGFSQVKLAGFLQDAGRYAEAEPLLLAALAAEQHAGQEQHHAAARAAAALVALYEAWGRPEEAARWRTTRGN